MGDIYGVTYTVTADGSNPKNRLALTADATGKERVHVRAILVSNDSTAAANGIKVRRGTAVSGGSAATEYSLNGNRKRGTPAADATTSTLTGDITVTGGQDLIPFDLAASDRECIKFQRDEFTLENESDSDYDSLVLQQPSGTNVLTFTILWEEH